MLRMFEEVQAKTRDLTDALQQQTATANVLKVISRSAFDLQAVLTTLAESARDLCGASFVTLSLREGDTMRLRAEWAALRRSFNSWAHIRSGLDARPSLGESC